MDYRFKHNIDLYTPSQTFDIDRGLSECCCELRVFGDLTSTEDHKNDHSLVFHKKASSADTVTFELSRCGSATVLDNYGQDVSFTNDALSVGYIFDWKQVLDNHGSGTYDVVISFTEAGQPKTLDWGKYTLSQWSFNQATDYVRIKTVFNTYNLKMDIDFTNSSAFDVIRVPGTFGKRDPKTEINQLIDKGRRSVKTTREHLNEYILETDPIKECISEKLIDLHLLNEDECYITDQNRFNHTYKLVNIPVVLSEPPEMNYLGLSRLLKMDIKFSDRVKNSKSYYNGL